MLPSDKFGLLTIVVVTHLTNLTTRDTKPNVIRLVFALDPFTVLGIRLDDDAVVPLAHHSSDFGQLLAFHVLAYESFERGACNLDVDRFFGHLIRPDRKKLERFGTRCTIENVPFEISPRKVWTGIDTFFTFMGPEHPKTGTTVDARVDALTPFWVIGQFEEDSCPKSERLRLGHKHVGPMDVNTGLHLRVHLSRFGACDDTPTFLNHRMHRRREFEDDVIWKRFGPLVIEVNEKLEHVRLLFHDVNLFAESNRVYTLYVKFVKLFVRNLKNSTIHEDVGPWALVCRPFIHS
jgi:hypothetical protein